MRKELNQVRYEPGHPKFSICNLCSISKPRRENEEYPNEFILAFCSYCYEINCTIDSSDSDESDLNQKIKKRNYSDSSSASKSSSQTLSNSVIPGSPSTSKGGGKLKNLSKSKSVANFRSLAPVRFEPLRSSKSQAKTAGQSSSPSSS